MFLLANSIEQLLQWCFSSTNLQILLLTGSGVLAIGLLTLALTRWGASRPVWKCVILSVMAHVLLIGYAWGTHLITYKKKDQLALSEPMRVNFQADSGEAATKSVADAGELAGPAAENGWDNFSVQSPLPSLVPTDELDRPGISSALVSVDRIVPQRNLLKGIPRNTTRPPTMPEFALPEPIPSAAVVASQPPALMPVPQSRPEIAAVSVPQQPIASESGDTQQRDALAPVATLEAFANTFEESAINAGSDDRFRAPPVAAGQFQPSRPLTEDPAVKITATGTFQPSTDAALEGAPRSPQMPAPPEIAAADSDNDAFRAVARDDAIAPRRADGQPLPQVYSLRTAANRMQTVIERGGSPETERAVTRALQWLANNQSRDGRWNPRKLGGGREDRVLGHDREGAGSQSDSGITALAVLAFLANGHTHLEGPYQHVIQHALEYIVSEQKSNGDLAGRAKLFARMYCHSMSLLAISEAYAMTGDRRLAVPAQRGVNFSLQAQNPRDGGWRYQPGDEGDMSQFGWQVLALHSAEAGGIDVPRFSKQKMVQFLDACCISPHKGVAAYRPGQGPNTTMTAEALVCRNLLGQRLSRLTVQEAQQRMAKSLPTPDRVNMYYWYYGTLAMYISGGDAWNQWNRQMKATLLTLQRTSGPDEGSWDPVGLWAGYGGRAYSTAMGALTLEVYYRYLPVYDVAQRNRRNELR